MTPLQKRFDEVAAECGVRELEGRIRRLAVARWSLPEIPAGADHEKLLCQLATRPALGERLRRREERARSELARRLAARGAARVRTRGTEKA